MTTEIARLLFYRGLLFGLCAGGVDAFPAQGLRLSRAFQSTLELAERLKNEADGAALKPFFSDFGVSPHAREMLQEGEHDALLWREEPDMRNARFVITRAEAENGLKKVRAPELFRTLGQHFAEQLRHA